MKVLWEESDIRAGRRVSREGMKEVWMIGYHASDPSCYVLVSLSDGMVCNPKTKAEMVGALATYMPMELLEGDR